MMSSWGTTPTRPVPARALAAVPSAPMHGRAAGRPAHPGHDVEQGGLAGAASAGDGREPPGGERQAGGRQRAGVADADGGRLEDDRRRRAPTAPRRGGPGVGRWCGHGGHDRPPFGVGGATVLACGRSGRHDRVTPHHRLAVEDDVAVPVRDRGAETGDRLVVPGAEDLDLRGDRLAGPDRGPVGPVGLQEHAAGPGQLLRNDGVEQAGGHATLHDDAAEAAGAGDLGVVVDRVAVAGHGGEPLDVGRGDQAGAPGARTDGRCGDGRAVPFDRWAAWSWRPPRRRASRDSGGTLRRSSARSRRRAWRRGGERVEPPGSTL